MEGYGRDEMRGKDEGEGEEETMLSSLILSGCHQITDVGLR